MSSKRDEVRAAGRGVLSIAAAKAYFIVASYAVYLGLPRLLSKEEFGQYSTALQLASILNNTLIVSTLQSVSKLVSEDEPHAQATLRQGLLIQLGVGGGLGVLLFAGGPLLAHHVYEDPRLGTLWQIAAAVLVAYALYAALMGSLNGRKRFQGQAGLDTTFSTLRTTGILAGAAIAGPLGAVGGFASAAVCVLLVGLLFVGAGQAGPRPPLAKWSSYILPLFSYHLFLNLVMLSDLLVLRGVVTRLAADGAQSGDPGAVAKHYVGLYRAAQTFAFVPYQLLLAVNFVVFPMVSKATSEGDVDKARATIRNGLRFSLLALLAFAAPISGAADGVMTLAYPEEYVAGAPALRLLVFGMVMFALFVVSTTALGGSGRPTFAALVGLMALLFVVTLNVVFVRTVGLGGHTLQAATLGTSLGMAVAMLAAAAGVYRTFGAWLPLGSIARGLAAAALGFGVAYVTPHDSPLMALVALAAGFFAYGAALLVLREVRAADLAVLKSVLKG
jgi:stage V sporulation protein B